jgi:hypothetical protein
VAATFGGWRNDIEKMEYKLLGLTFMLAGVYIVFDMLRRLL